MSEFDETTIPSELRNRPQWICWKEGQRNGKLTKIPMNPDGSGGTAKSNDMATWGEFDQAVKTAKSNEWGIGFVFSDADPYMGIDLDGCVREDGGPKDWLPTLDAFTRKTFIEYSPSGTGLHVIVEGSVPEWWINQDEDDDEGHKGVECYDSGRFFTFTGDMLDSSGNGVSADCDVHEWLLGAWFKFNEDGPFNEGHDESHWQDLDVEFDVHDIISFSRYPEEKNTAHPFHGSTTGSNFRVDKGGDTWRCWRHGVTGNASHLLGMEQGVIECGEWSNGGLSSDTWRDIFDAARDDGYDIPEPDTWDSGPDVKAGEEAREGNEQGSEDKTDRALSERLRSEVVVPYNPPDDYDGETIDQNVAVYRAARIIDDELYFVRPREETRGWRDCLYMYVDGEYVGGEDDAGIYEPNAKNEIERLAERHFMDIANDAFVRELTNKIERRNRVRAKKLEPDSERLVVNNGILDLTTGEVHEHTPSEYHRTKIDIEYDPSAECPRIDKFLHSIVDDDDVDTLYRFIAHTLYKGYPEAKAAMLLGDGANGKSMFLSLIERFLGEFNVSGRSLQDITEYRWAANDLVGKLANIHADMSDQDVDSMRMFKNLTGGDTVDADVKFEKPVKFTNHATMMFACNDMPVLRDDTQGNWRRWVLINFPHTFDSDDPTAQDAKPREQLEKELFDESELQGLLARCVEEIKAWDDGREWFPGTAGWRETRSKMRRAAEPVFDFAEECLVNDGDAMVEKSDVREAYRRYATREGLPKLDREEFGRKLVMLSDYDVEPAQKRAEDGPGRVMIYKGIDLNQRGKALIGEAEGFDAKEAALQVLRSEDGRVPEAMVIERLESEYSIDNGRAEHAIGELKKEGRFMLTHEHNVDWVEIP